MTRTVALIVCMAILSSPASGEEKKDYFKVSNEITSLLEIGKFDEALGLIRGKKSLCKGYNQVGFCYMGEKDDAEAELTAKIELARRCSTAIQEISAKHPGTREEATALKAQVQMDCDRDKALSARRNNKQLPQSLMAKAAELTKNLTEIEKNGPHSEVTADGGENPLAVAKNRCVIGIRWGYILKGKSNPKKNQVENLQGQFKTKDECEEARLTDPKADSNTRLMGGAACVQRYLGEPINVTLATIDIMKKGLVKGEMAKESALFLSMADCQSISEKGADIDNGLDKDNLYFKVSHINAVGSTDVPRFIGSCAETTMVICDKFAFAPNDVQIMH